MPDILASELLSRNAAVDSALLREFARLLTELPPMSRGASFAVETPLGRRVTVRPQGVRCLTRER